MVPTTVMLLLKRMDCNGGVASYCETLIRGLCARGDRVILVTGPVTELFGSAQRRSTIEGLVDEWIQIDSLRSTRFQPRVVGQLLRVMRIHGIDVISPQGLAMLPLAYVLSKLSRCPIVANYHPSRDGDSPESIATQRSLAERLGYRALLGVFKPDRLIAISRDIVDFYVQDCGVRDERVSCIVNGVNTSVFRPPSIEEKAAARKALGIDDGTLVCVLSGRLDFVKGHDIVTDAVRQLRAQRPSLKIVCLFPGGGDKEADVKAYALHDDADAHAFRFLGFLSSTSALREVYWAADVALLPSRFEGSPIFIAEAMNCGCVPVRTPSGGWRDQIEEGVTGYIVPFNDADALAGRIADLANDALRERLRANAIEHAQGHLSQDRMIAATSDLYRVSAAGQKRNALA